MFDRLKLSHHHHSGRLRPHEYTSYAPLVILMLIVGVALSAYISFASDEHPAPKAGSIGLSGTMPGESPTEAAKINSPIDGAHFTKTPITFQGTCRANLLVEVFKNDIFAGSTVCGQDGAFSIDVDLLIGKNDITARVYDALHQAGPVSNQITVYYDVMPSQGSPITSLNLGLSEQMLLNTNSVFRGTFPGQNLSMPISIIGGAPPYALNIQWGDLENNVVSRADNLSFNAVHKYEKAGTYQVSIQATDSQGRVSFLSVAVIVNGQIDVVAATEESATKSFNQLLILWPLYVAMVGIIIAFWLGEKRERHILKKQGILAEGA